MIAWLEAVPDDELHLSAVTLGEIQAGIELTRDSDPHKADEIEAWANLVAMAYNVLPMDGATFRVWARLMHHRSDTLYEDAMIAATAMVHRLVVVINLYNSVAAAMTIETTYSQAREQLKSLMDRAVDDREVILVRRRSGDAVAIIAADELQSLMETAHLLRSPKNAQRLLAALRRANILQTRRTPEKRGLQ